MLLLLLVVGFYRRLGHYLLKIGRCFVLVLLVIVSFGIIIIGKAAVLHGQKAAKILIRFVGLKMTYVLLNSLRALLLLWGYL